MAKPGVVEQQVIFLGSLSAAPKRDKNNWLTVWKLPELFWQLGSCKAIFAFLPLVTMAYIHTYVGIL